MSDWKQHVSAHLKKLGLNPAREAEISDELSQHLEDRYREFRSAGKTEDEAVRLALDEIDDAELLVKEMKTLRQSNRPEVVPAGMPGRNSLADIWQDFVFAARTLRKQRGFAIAAILTLALGIGANTTIFSLVNATLLRRLPVQNRDRLFYVFNRDVWFVPSYPLYETLRNNVQSFEKLAAWGAISASLNADGETDIVTGVIVTGNLFEMLGVEAERGRVISPADDVTPGGHPVAVISHRLWQTRFAGRGDIVGHEILLNARPFTIIGVAKPDFPGPQQGVMRDLFVPMMMQPLMRPPRAGYFGDMDPDLLKNPGNSWLFTAGRLKPSITRAQAEAEVSAVLTNDARTRNPNAAERRMSLLPIDAGEPLQRRQMTSAAALLTGVVAIILLIACANVANLLLSKASARRRELAIRLAIGANRWRIVRQLLTESVLLALMGGAAGVGLAWAVATGLKAAPPPAGALPIALDFAIDYRVLLFSFVLSAITGIVFGLVPALQSSRPSVTPALKSDSFVPEERGHHFNIKKVLVVAEVALSLVLLVAAGLLIRSLWSLQQIDPGISADQVISAPLNVNLLRFTRAQGREFYSKVIERMQALPGVGSASVARVAVMTGGARVATINVEGREPVANPQGSEGRGMSDITARENAFASFNVVSAGFLKTLGIPLVRGRDFTTDDADGRPLVAVVSEAFVRRFFPNEDPIGKRFSPIAVRSQAPEWTEIVGVVRDSKYASLNEAPQPVVYQPILQKHETGVTLYVRATLPPETLIPAVRREIQDIEPNLPLPIIETVEQTIEASLYVPRMGAWLVGVFAGLALLLASVGVYGVMSFATSRRTRELGIRIALGADSRRVFALVIGEGMVLVAVGVAIGLLGALAVSRTLSAFLSGIGPRDVITFVTVPILLGIVAFAACYLPARRAMAVSPIEAIRDM